MGILKAGVEIVTMSPERRYTKAAVGDIVGLLEPIIIMSRAHEESAVKSEQIADVWKQRRKHANQTPMNAVGPAWLRMEGGRWCVAEARAAVVRRIFALAIDGLGMHAIAAALNKAKVLPMGRGKTWNFSYVWLILRNRAVLGEFQPHAVKGKRVPVGKPIPGYYPAVIDEATFYRAAAALDARKNQKGPRGRHVRNLFTSLLRDLEDEKKDVAARLERAKAEAATSEAEVLGETQSLADLLADAEGEELLELRTKIKARIAQLVGEMWMLVVPRGRERVAALQVWFAGGKCHRDLIVLHRPRAGWSARSLVMDAVPGELDLRKPEHAAKLAEALATADLE